VVVKVGLQVVTQDPEMVKNLKALRQEIRTRLVADIYYLERKNNFRINI
jgi:hypothetical protein